MDFLEGYKKKERKEERRKARRERLRFRATRKKPEKNKRRGHAIVSSVYVSTSIGAAIHLLRSQIGSLTHTATCAYRRTRADLSTGIHRRM